MSLFCVGLNHHTAPLEVREQFSLPETDLAKALNALETDLGIKYSVIISTCNRCEIYAESEQPDEANRIIKWLCQNKNLTREQVTRYFYQLDESETIKHLMRVASSLDSMIIGEPQILGQVKASYQVSLLNQHINTVIGKLFDQALATAKQVRSTTELGRHQISYASVAVSLAKKIFQDLSTKHALMIGTGEMIETSIKQFQKQQIGTITIAGRSPQRTEDLASKFATQSLALSDIANQLYQYDLIISCTASNTTILKKEVVEVALKKRKQALMCITDLALPRDIEPSVAELDNVYLYTLDNLTHIVDINRYTRLSVVSEAEKIVAQCADEFTRWLDTRKISHLVTQLKSRADEHGEQALRKAIKLIEQGKTAEEALGYLRHTLTAKLTHDSINLLNEIATSKNKALLESIIKLYDNDKNLTI